MDAMGLTAWVSRPTGGPGVAAAPVAPAVPAAAAEERLPEVAPPPEPIVAPTPPAPERPATAGSPAGASTEPRAAPPAEPRPEPPPTGTIPPSRPPAARALSARRAVAFERRGARTVETNPGGGTVLVAVERGAGTRPGLPPLEREPAELFALMLRSIGLGRADVSLCALDAPDAPPGGDGPADAGTDGEADEGAGPALRELLGGPRRTVLLLVHDAGGAGAADVSDDPALRALGVAAFRVPHPTLLLERPVAKREAWAALKAVRRRLADLAPGTAPGTVPGNAP